MISKDAKLFLNHKILNTMYDELQEAPVIYRPSEFWEKLNRIHVKQLSEAGLDNFKRTVNMRYFNWGTTGIIFHQLKPILSALLSGNFSPFLKPIFKNYKQNLSCSSLSNFNLLSAWIYKTYVASLFDYVSQIDQHNLLKNINEPSIGNPFVINYCRNIISQDLCNSVHEFYRSTENIDYTNNINIAELGAGYGRLAYVFLNTMPKATYCIIDIPPALYVAQEYLSEIFPNEKIFYFRVFKSYEEVKDEFESSRIRFIMAHQIEYLPDNSFSLFINISSLHEMTRDQISNYIKLIDRLVEGYFYLKEWFRSRTKVNFYITESEYPIPKYWEKVYKQQHPVQRRFFEALYKIS